MTTAKQVLRWIAVLPGALLAGVIVLFLAHWAAIVIHSFGPFGDPVITTADGKGLLQAMPLESLERFGDALFVPGTVVVVGAFIAPRHRFITAVALTTLFVGLNVFVFALVRSGHVQVDDASWRLIITVVLWIVSISLALFRAREFDADVQSFALQEESAGFFARQVQHAAKEEQPKQEAYGQANDHLKIEEVIREGPTRIAPIIDACCEDPNKRAFAQSLLDNALEAGFFLYQLAVFANTKVNVHVTIKKWKNAGLKLPAEGTPEFYPY